MELHYILIFILFYSTHVDPFSSSCTMGSVLMSAATSAATPTATSAATTATSTLPGLLDLLHMGIVVLPPLLMVHLKQLLLSQLLLR